MVNQKIRSRSDKKTIKRLPGGGHAIHTRRGKVNTASCSDCGEKLSGVPTGNKFKISKLPKTKKRPERPFGGVLCGSCLKKIIKEKLRMLR